jgi:hypothetical protein
MFLISLKHSNSLHLLSHSNIIMEVHQFNWLVVMIFIMIKGNTPTCIMLVKSDLELFDRSLGLLHNDSNLWESAGYHID